MSRIAVCAIAMASGKALPCSVQHCSDHSAVQGARGCLPACVGLPPSPGRGVARALCLGGGRVCLQHLGRYG
eukprot:9016553-Lingulodinium_polyedra.AAC.1